jgi:hypothetical protein
MSDTAVPRPFRHVSDLDQLRLLDRVDKVFDPVIAPHAAPAGSAARREDVRRMILELDCLAGDLECTLGRWPAVTSNELGTDLLTHARAVHNARWNLCGPRAAWIPGAERAALTEAGEHAWLALDTRLDQALSLNPSNYAAVKAAVRNAVLAMIAAATGGQAGTPATPSAAQGNANRGTKGKNIDARMLKVMAENQESHGWSARQWADHLDCSDGTVKDTKTWKERLKAARAMAAVDHLGRSEPHPKSRRGK